MADSMLWGRLAAGYHLTNVLLHAGCVLLLFRFITVVLARAGGRSGNTSGPPDLLIVRKGLSPEVVRGGRLKAEGGRLKLSRSAPERDNSVTVHTDPFGDSVFRIQPSAFPDALEVLAAGLATLVFAVHPVNSEAVCLVSFREDLLALLFVLAGLNLASVHPRAGIGRAVAVTGACVLCFLLAVASKENGAAGPFLLAAYALTSPDWRPRWRAWGLLTGAALVAVLGFLWARFALAPSTSHIFTGSPSYLGGSFVQMLKLQPRIWALYAQFIVFPRGLCAHYGIHSLRHLGLAVSIVIVAAVVVGAAFFAWQRRSAVIGIAFVVFGLAPVSNLIPIYIPAADRYLYMPMAGVAICLGVLMTMIAGGRAAPWRRVLVPGVVVAVCAALAVVTVRRERVWGDSVRLWQDTAQKNPRSHTAANNLGYALYELGRYDEAAASWSRAIHVTGGRDPDSLAGLALALDALGRRRQAAEVLRKAIALDARYGDPDRLVAALVCEPHTALALKALILRTGL
jgi:hypothetical protein